MTDKKKLEYCEKIVRTLMNDISTKKITEEEFTKKFIEYCSYIEYYKKKLNMPVIIDENAQIDDDELLQLNILFN